ncbi:acyl-CoA synthetase [Halovenus marina]|uniref:acyl-CoA synthetase n=1 Tax=Halovenus marina TaxID=3396621 RepID=UPI003F54CFAB
MPAEDTSFGTITVDWAEEPVPNLAAFEDYEDARESFEWDIPETFNIATDTVTKHADKRGSVALFQDIEDGPDRTHTFWQLDRRSNQIANALDARGIGEGDRIAILGTRSDKVMLTHLAAWKLGAISVPLSVLYGPDGLSFRLEDCEATAVFAAPDLFDTVAESVANVDTVELIAGFREEPTIEGSETIQFDELGADRSHQFDAVETDPEDPAMILYTSGTTGKPKGVVQAHQALIGWLPSFQMCFELPWSDDDPLLYVTPDLAWIGGLNLILGTWHYGCPAFRYDSNSGFDPTTVYDNIEKWGPTRAVLVPGMLKPMSELDSSQWDLSTLSVVMSGSEPVSESLYDFVTETLGANLNEMYGQTEAIHLVTTCSQWFDVEPGSLGFPAPGHDVAIVDDDGERVDVEETGHIALRKPDPAMFRRLWNDEEGTEKKFIGEWMDTSDLGYRDEDGRLWFKSRDDNLIITQGYRVGPPEVEDSIIELTEVANVGVIGVEDSQRGEIVKAYVEPQEGVEPGAELREQIQTHVREQLAKYQYPREIEFIDEMPTTVTGKVRRHELEELEAQNG